MSYALSTDRDPPPDALIALYDSVGWSTYTRDPDALQRAVRNSTWVATAWEGEALIGLARVVSDEVAIAWLQDVLVHPDHHRTGVGRALVQAALRRFEGVRSFSLMTDDEPKQHAFYRSLGLEEIRAAHGGVLHCFVRFR